MSSNVIFRKLGHAFIPDVFLFDKKKSKCKRRLQEKEQNGLPARGHVSVGQDGNPNTNKYYKRRIKWDYK